MCVLCYLVLSWMQFKYIYQIQPKCKSDKIFFKDIPENFNREIVVSEMFVMYINQNCFRNIFSLNGREQKRRCKCSATYRSFWTMLE